MKQQSIEADNVWFHSIAMAIDAYLDYLNYG